MANAETFAGEVAQHLRVESRDIIVRGGLVNGATVHGGRNLTVYGAFKGPANTKADGVITVYGEFDGDVGENEGAIMIAGLITWEAATSHRVAIAIGSIITGNGGPWVLQEHGELSRPKERSEGTNTVPGDSDPKRFCIWDTHGQKFHQVGDDLALLDEEDN